MKTEAMNEFLKKIESLFLQNDNVDTNTIYSLLIGLGTKRERIHDFFPKWIERFRDRENIKVFHDVGWPAFCQFINEDLATVRFIKLYIPLVHYSNNAVLIFCFIYVVVLLIRWSKMPIRRV